MSRRSSYESIINNVHLEQTNEYDSVNNNRITADILFDNEEKLLGNSIEMNKTQTRANVSRINYESG